MNKQKIWNGISEEFGICEVVAKVDYRDGSGSDGSFKVKGIMDFVIDVLNPPKIMIPGSSGKLKLMGSEGTGVILECGYVCKDSQTLLKQGSSIEGAIKDWYDGLPEQIEE